MSSELVLRGGRKNRLQDVSNIEHFWKIDMTSVSFHTSMDCKNFIYTSTFVYTILN